MRLWMWIVAAILWLLVLTALWHGAGCSTAHPC